MNIPKKVFLTFFTTATLICACLCQSPFVLNSTCTRRSDCTIHGNTQHPHCHDCTQFVVCLKGNYAIVNCPATSENDVYYDVRTGTCTSRDKALCGLPSSGSGLSSDADVKGAKTGLITMPDGSRYQFSYFSPSQAPQLHSQTDSGSNPGGGKYPQQSGTNPVPTVIGSNPTSDQYIQNTGTDSVRKDSGSNPYEDQYPQQLVTNPVQTDKGSYPTKPQYPELLGTDSLQTDGSSSPAVGQYDSSSKQYQKAFQVPNQNVPSYSPNQISTGFDRNQNNAAANLNPYNPGSNNPGITSNNLGISPNDPGFSPNNPSFSPNQNVQGNSPKQIKPSYSPNQNAQGYSPNNVNFGSNSVQNNPVQPTQSRGGYNANQLDGNYGTNQNNPSYTNQNPSYDTNKNKPTYGTNQNTPSYDTNQNRGYANQNQGYTNQNPSFGTNQNNPSYDSNQNNPSYGTNQNQGYTNQNPSYGTSQNKPTYDINQNDPRYGTNRNNPTYDTNQNPSYTNQNNPSYGNQINPARNSNQNSDYNTNQNNPSYDSNQNKPTYGTNRNDPQYNTNQNNPSYNSNRNDPAYKTNQNPTYTNQNDPNYKNQNNPGRNTNQNSSYNTNRNNPTYDSNQNDPDYGTNQNKPSYDSNKNNPTYGTNKNEPTYDTNQNPVQHQQRNQGYDANQNGRRSDNGLRTSDTLHNPYKTNRFQNSGFSDEPLSSTIGNYFGNLRDSFLPFPGFNEFTNSPSRAGAQSNAPNSLLSGFQFPSISDSYKSMAAMHRDLNKHIDSLGDPFQQNFFDPFPIRSQLEKKSDSDETGVPVTSQANTDDNKVEPELDQGTERTQKQGEDSEDTRQKAKGERNDPEKQEGVDNQGYSGDKGKVDYERNSGKGDIGNGLQRPPCVLGCTHKGRALDGSFHHCETCSMFVRCEKGKSTLVPCPTFLDWDDNRQQCVMFSSTCRLFNRF